MIARFGIRTLVIAAFVIIAVLALSVWQCTQSRQKAAQARQDVRGSEAYASAAKVAVEAVVARTDAEAGLAVVVAQASKDIAAAKGADQPITPEVRSAALAAACRLASYAGDARCVVK